MTVVKLRDFIKEDVKKILCPGVIYFCTLTRLLSFINASKMQGEVKFVISLEYFFFFAIFNSNIVRYMICLKFILKAK